MYKVSREIKASFFLILCLLSSCRSCPTSIQLCEKVTLHSSVKIKLSETEKQMVYGDPNVEAYKLVPELTALIEFRLPEYKITLNLEGPLSKRPFSR